MITGLAQPCVLVFMVKLFYFISFLSIFSRAHTFPPDSTKLPVEKLIKVWWQTRLRLLASGITLCVNKLQARKSLAARTLMIVLT